VSKQQHEVRYLEKTEGLPASLIQDIIDQVGPSRKKMVEKLREMKKNVRK
jgi:hypothetical protein